MSFLCGEMEAENIDNFMIEESDILLSYCNHISVFYFDILRCQKELESPSKIIYQCFFYDKFDDMTKDEEAKLCLEVSFHIEEAEIQVTPTFGNFTAKVNFELGDGVSFIEDSLNSDFFIESKPSDYDFL